MINTTNIFDYEDVQLIPNKCIVTSRSECDTHVKLGNRTFRLPVVPANMQTIIDEELAEKLAREGYFYIMHRFQPERRMDFVKRMHDLNLYSSISIGVKPEEFALVDEFKKANLTPEYITIDIAHGHSNAVIDMIQYIKKNLPGTFVIAGNVGTPEAVRELENAGADATKVGIGPGKVCITKLKTGFGTGGWQLAAVRWCAKAATKPIIADGGILFAGHEESPGEEKIVDGKAVKEYFGSASEFQKGERKNVEGKKIFIDSKGSIFDTLVEMEQDLQSAISYAGGTTLQAIRKVDYVLVKNSIFNGDR
ncbi:MAG: GMP reductase [Veillonella sp.]|nr:GMP reductase [Veillonella sp.]